MDSTAAIASILQGYAQGNFLMADEDGILGWYRSSVRTLIPLDGRFRYPTSLRRVLNQRRFTMRISTDFAGVVDGCAARPETWISPQLKQLYQALHRAGWAQSFEAWHEGQLAGGILGLVIGGVFIGESMFYAQPEASKAAMVALVQHLRCRGYRIFDAQLMNPHLARFGAYQLDDAEYSRQLARAIALPCHFLPGPEDS